MTFTFTVLLIWYTNRTKWLKLNGAEFKVGAGIVYRLENDLPQIVQITALYVINGGSVVIKGDCYTTTYDPHLRAYSLYSLNKELFLAYDELSLTTPVHVRTCRVSPSRPIMILLYGIDNYFIS